MGDQLHALDQVRSTAIDQFAATAPPTSTPEPATYGLMGLGFGVFAWFRRRK